MGVYIDGMEMPKKYPVTVTIFPDGISVVKTISGRRFTATAVPVPPHGRLIDGDVAEVISFTAEDSEGKDFYDGILYAADFISQQPTIIQAEEGE